MSKRNIGVLPMNAKYVLVKFFQWNSNCQNCWRDISNCVLLKRVDNGLNQEIIVGEDCADTISQWEISNWNELLDKKSDFNKYKRAISAINKAVKEGGFRIVPIQIWVALWGFKNHKYFLRTDKYLKRPELKINIENYIKIVSDKQNNV